MSKSVVYVVANENFQDEEFFESKKILESKGYSIKLASSKAKHMENWAAVLIQSFYLAK